MTSSNVIVGVDILQLPRARLAYVRTCESEINNIEFLESALLLKKGEGERERRGDVCVCEREQCNLCVGLDHKFQFHTKKLKFLSGIAKEAVITAAAFEDRRT